jgi:hypothetical protein
MTTTESHPDLVERLSRISTARPRDPFVEIAWDDPESAIDPNDPRWELPADHPLGATSWYQERPAHVRRAIGLDVAATFVKIGSEFESLLNRGLLELADALPDDAPETRYAYHELIEECHHILMFREFLKRARSDVRGLSPLFRALGWQITRLGRRWPELFFVFVIGGEEPIDHIQRENLRPTRTLPPLLKRIMQLHVAEEGRHLCFAQSFLRTRLPRSSRVSRAALAVIAPIILRVMADMMMKPSRHVIDRWAIPDEVMEEAYGRPSRHVTDRLAALRRIRGLLEELGIISRLSAPLWKLLAIA